MLSSVHGHFWKLGSIQLRRTFATVSHGLPKLPSAPRKTEWISPTLDEKILGALERSKHGHTPLWTLIDQCAAVSGQSLDCCLPYESRPTEHRRPILEGDGGEEVVLVAHCAKVGEVHKITVAAGFALAAQHDGDHSLILTCTHTLEEMRRSSLLLRSSSKEATESITGTYIVCGPEESPSLYPVSQVAAALPNSDLILLACKMPGVKTLPVSPYPAPKETKLRVHLVAHHQPTQPGWHPWIGGTWRRWAKGTVLGYRDFAGREAEPGTYDALNHLYFTPEPTFGSSGGPIIDEESGAVIGVLLGSRLDSRIEGTRGWGVPAESIFEMFALPGLSTNSRRSF